MKLLVVLSIEAHASGIRRLFSEHSVPVFSEAPISGFRLASSSAQTDNWFGNLHEEIYSQLVFAFVEKAKAEELFTALQSFSAERSDEHPVRAFQLSVDKFL